MSTISFARDARAVLTGARTLAVLAPARCFTQEILTAFLAEDHANLLHELAQNTKPGDLGRTASTLASSAATDAKPKKGRKKAAGPRKLVAGVLPNTVSRYNSPARAEAIRRTARAAVGPDTTAVIIVLEDKAHQLAAVNAVARALPLFSARSKQPSGKRTVKILTVDTAGKAIAVDKVARTTVEMSRDSACLVDTPPTELGPATFAKRVRAMLRGVTGVRVRELSGDALVKNNLGGIEAVGRAGQEPPRLLIATYKPKKASKRHLALVGKGITFDTGGLHLKPRTAMNGMKIDMGGAAAVLGAFRVLVSTGFPHQLSLLLCLAENAIGPTAFKPDDILNMHSGKTVEINNTDAEGRLVLADGVSYATRTLGVDTVINAATLTGAQLVATGMLHAAVVSNSAELEQTLIEAGRDSGDLVHPLPFAPELYHKEFESKVADMRNSVKNRSNAQTSCAAQFVYNHLEGCDVTWGHVDLAGPAWLDERGTGYGVALLAETLRRL